MKRDIAVFIAMFILGCVTAKPTPAPCDWQSCARRCQDEGKQLVFTINNGYNAPSCVCEDEEQQP